MEKLTPKEVYDLIRQGAADGGWQGFAIKVQEALIDKNGYQVATLEEAIEFEKKRGYTYGTPQNS